MFRCSWKSKILVLQASFPIQSFPYLKLLHWREKQPLCRTLGRNSFAGWRIKCDSPLRKTSLKSTNRSSSTGCCCDASVAKRKEAVTQQRLTKLQYQYSLHSLTVSQNRLVIGCYDENVTLCERGPGLQFPLARKEGVVQLMCVEDCRSAWPQVWSAWPSTSVPEEESFSKGL